jgi:DNA polymerase-3 subunit delta
VNREGLASWLEQRLLKETIRADATALQLLMDKFEGNLLAVMQEMEKLKLTAAMILVD